MRATSCWVATCSKPNEARITGYPPDLLSADLDGHKRNRRDDALRTRGGSPPQMTSSERSLFDQLKVDEVLRRTNLELMCRRKFMPTSPSMSLCPSGNTVSAWASPRPAR